MIKRLRRAWMALLCVVLVSGSMASAVPLTGRVYEGPTGVEPPTAKPIAGVTVGLYGSNNANDDGTGNPPIQTTTTNGDGWYSLTVRGAYNFYNILQTNKAGYADSRPSPSATSVGGTVKSSNWIQYRYEALSGTTTGNKFWDQQEGPVIPEEFELIYQFDGPSTIEGPPGTIVMWEVYVTLTNSVPVQAWVIAASISDPLLLQPWMTDTTGTVAADSTFAEYAVSGGYPDGVIAGVILDYQSPWGGQTLDPSPQGRPHKLLHVTLMATIPTAPATARLEFRDRLYSNGPLSNEVVVNGASIESSNGLRLLPQTITLKPIAEPAEQAYDYGDAPDASYRTLQASNGARHLIIPGFHLGAGIDGEPDGQATPDATGDDQSGADDEDGVVFLTPLMPGQQAQIEVIASRAGLLDGWVDYDSDGSWAQTAEQVFFSEPLAAGHNTLTFQVPSGIAVHRPTFARFRLSSAGGLPPDGPGQDGEVEDYRILLGEGEEQPYLKWSQPPLEIDPKVDEAPFFCGWDEPARSTQRSGQSRQWRMDADDFHCLGPIPITRIRWWGGYEAWAQPEPPASQPMTWHIGIWANQVEGLRLGQLYPERLVWSIEVPDERVDRGAVGRIEFPQQQSPEMCFGYEVRLESQEWFHQAEFPSNGDIFWLSITAIYPPNAEQGNMWGWTTRPHVWGDGAVTPAIMGEWPTSEERLFPGRITPIESSALCGQSRPYDLCFELLTEQPWIQSDQPFTGIRDWPHYEDVESQGISIRQEETISRFVADDWRCEQDLPVIGLAWWGSYIGYGHKACGCDGQDEPPRPDYFLLRISRNAPAGGTGSPGDVIWEYRASDYDEVLVGYDKHPEGEPNEPVFRYTVRLPEEEWFRPENAGETYWFSITAIYTDPLPMIVHPWGWTNHRGLSGGAAVSRRVDSQSGWRWDELLDQTQQPQDMSFTVFTVPEW